MAKRDAFRKLRTRCLYQDEQTVGFSCRAPLESPFFVWLSSLHPIEVSGQLPEFVPFPAVDRGVAGVALFHGGVLFGGLFGFQRIRPAGHGPERQVFFRQALRF